MGSRMENNTLSEIPRLSLNLELTSDQESLSQEQKEPMEKQSKKTDESRERIIQSALKLFAEKGFFETRIPEISAHAKVGVGSLYRHFKNKEDIFNETFRSCVLNFGKFLDEDLLKDLSPKDRFFSFWQGLGIFSQNRLDQFIMIDRNFASSLLDEESIKESNKLESKINHYLSLSDEEEELYLIYPCIIFASFTGILRFHVIHEKNLESSVLEQSALMLWDGFSNIPKSNEKKKEKRSKKI